MNYLVSLRNLENKDELYYAIDIRFYSNKFGLQLLLPEAKARWCYFQEAWYTKMEVSMNLDPFLRGQFDENGRVLMRPDIKEIIGYQEGQYRSHLKSKNIKI